MAAEPQDTVTAEHPERVWSASLPKEGRISIIPIRTQASGEVGLKARGMIFIPVQIPDSGPFEEKSYHEDAEAVAHVLNDVFCYTTLRELINILNEWIPEKE